jgi:xanthine dehydrogenase accessory factor
MFKDIVVVRSGGDIGTAVAHMLHRSGFKVLILEIANPLAIRRRVAFCEAIFDKEIIIEQVKCKKANTLEEIYEFWEKDLIPIFIDATGEILKEIKAAVVVDAILAKRNTNTYIKMAELTIGLGPGFTAGADVHVVIETNRGHDLGRIIFSGEAEKDTGIPGKILGYAAERVLRAPCDGKVRILKSIGDSVDEEEIILYVEDEAVKSKIRGVIRGCIKDGVIVTKGLKIGDVDPRGKTEYCDTISDKARCIAGGVLEAILLSKKRGLLVNDK